jgi:hypothetical protein
MFMMVNQLNFIVAYMNLFKREKLIGIRNNVRCYLPKIFDNE